MNKIWGFLFVAISIIALACSDDVSHAENDENHSGILIVEPIDITDSSSQSSSSAYHRSTKTIIYFSNKVETTSSSAAPTSSTSSSSKQQKSSSSSKPIPKSSSSEKKSSSSKPPQSSSSIIESSSSTEPQSSSALRFFDCTEHDCVIMDYLNPDISYGEMLDTRDNQVYRTLVISNHVWTAQSMNYKIEAEENREATNWCYKNDPDNCKKLGRLYAWDAAQKACPEGWHLPTVDDWKELLEDQSCNTTQSDDGTWIYDCTGNRLKATDSWDSQKEERKNALGFSVTGAGIRFEKKDIGINEAAIFWSATDTLSFYAFAVIFQDNENSTLLGAIDKENGFSVRCIKGKAE